MTNNFNGTYLKTKLQRKVATFYRNPEDNNRQKEGFYWRYWKGEIMGQRSLERQPW